MLGSRKVIALIPARGGSKRLPRKNVLPFGDKPLISWTIEAALRAKFVDEVVVTTDCTEIASVSKKSGASVPFLRPPELATDTATTSSVLEHAITTLGCSSEDIIVLLQPTSPLRTSSDIDSALELLHKRSANGVVSVCECEHSPIWTGVLPKEGHMGDFLPKELTGVRSQDLPVHYRLNGAIYAFTVHSLLSQKGIHYSVDVYAYVMSQTRSADIDSELDFSIAETLLKKKK